MSSTLPQSPAAPLRYTVSDIKRIYEANKPDGGGHYFDRETLKFFGQQLRDFRALHIGGRVYLYAPNPKAVMPSIREFIPETGALKFLNNETRALVEAAAKGVK